MIQFVAFSLALVTYATCHAQFEPDGFMQDLATEPQQLSVIEPEVFEGTVMTASFHGTLESTKVELTEPASASG